MPPTPATISLAHRTALRRTPDLMAKFAKLKEGREGGGRINDVHSPSQASVDNYSFPLLISTALADDFSGHIGEANVPSTSNLAANSSSRSPSASSQSSDDGVAWWQTVCSDDLLANGLPDVPAVPCHRRKPTERKTNRQISREVRTANPYWEDITTLKRIKSTHHKLSALRRDAPTMGMSSHVDDYDSEVDDSVDGQRVQEGTAVGLKQKALQQVDVSSGGSITASLGRTTLQMFCSTILEHAGFDSGSSFAIVAVGHHV